MVVNIIADRNLSVGEALKDFFVTLRHLRLDIIEKQSEVFWSREEKVRFEREVYLMLDLTTSKLRYLVKFPLKC